MAVLLRRAGLSNHARLTVQAAANNSLKFQDIERCRRNMEDELYHQDEGKRHHLGHRGCVPYGWKKLDIGACACCPKRKSQRP